MSWFSRRDTAKPSNSRSNSSLAISKFVNNIKLRFNKPEQTVLDVFSLNLSEIPSQLLVGKERHLQELNAGGNAIIELPQVVFSLTSLRVLNLEDNMLSSISPSVGSLINLEELYLSKNHLSNVPEAIRGCRKMRIMDLSCNELAVFPDGLSSMLNLTELYLNDVKLRCLPNDIGRLLHLTVLELRGNYLSSLPNSFSNLRLLERLDFGSNLLSGDFPAALCQLSRVKELWLDCNELSSISEAVSTLVSLEFLDISQNLISFIAQNSISSFRHLAFLDLRSNQLNHLPFCIGRLLQLATLRLDDNLITTLPSSFGSMSMLTELSLSRNRLKELPGQIGCLGNLEIFYCDENHLHHLPTQICDCSKLTVLSLRSNELTTVPAQLCQLSSLHVLNLCDNQLNFLPTSFLLLNKTLSALWLSENQSSPKPQLQLERDRVTGHDVLTCVWLPQKCRQSETTAALFCEAEQFNNNITACNGMRVPSFGELQQAKIIRLVQHEVAGAEREDATLQCGSSSQKCSQSAGRVSFSGAKNKKLSSLKIAKIKPIQSALPALQTPSYASHDINNAHQDQKGSEQAVNGQNSSDCEEEWTLQPGYPPQIKPYATVDIETLQRRLEMEEHKKNTAANQQNLKTASAPSQTCTSGATVIGRVNRRRPTVPSAPNFSCVKNRSNVNTVLSNGSHNNGDATALHYEPIFETAAVAEDNKQQVV